MKCREDAVELYAVYENGVLTGLREADEEEQAEWSRLRQKNTDQINLNGTEAQGEPRGETGTAEDYASLFNLMAPGYKDLSVADFNMSLLDWANENYERMEWISIDTGWDENQYSVNGYIYSVYGRGIVASLGDLRHMPFLEEVVIEYQPELDISALADCTEVKKLSLVGDNLDNQDIEALRGMKQLTTLNLGWNNISDISALNYNQEEQQECLEE